MAKFGRQQMPSSSSKLVASDFYRAFSVDYQRKSDNLSSQAPSSSGMSERQA